MLCIAMAMFYLAHKKKEKNFLIPGFVLLASGLTNAVLGLMTGQ